MNSEEFDRRDTFDASTCDCHRGRVLLSAIRKQDTNLIRSAVNDRITIRETVRSDGDVTISVIQELLLDAFDGDLTGLETLKNAGISIDEPIDDSGRTGLMASVWHGIEVTKWFIEMGADVAKADSLGNTALHYACATDLAFVSDEELLAIIELLMVTGCDPETRNESGKTCEDVIHDQQVETETSHRITKIIRRGRSGSVSTF